jgi:hypothetical protein
VNNTNALKCCKKNKAGQLGQIVLRDWGSYELVAGNDKRRNGRIHVYNLVSAHDMVKTIF